MAVRHPSAVKRNRQNLKRRARNKAIRSRVRGEVREIRDSSSGGNVVAAEAQLKVVIKGRNKAATKGVLHPNAASRRIARLSKHVHALKQAQ